MVQPDNVSLGVPFGWLPGIGTLLVMGAVKPGWGPRSGSWLLSGFGDVLGGDCGKKSVGNYEYSDIPDYNGDVAGRQKYVGGDRRS